MERLFVKLLLGLLLLGVLGFVAYALFGDLSQEPTPVSQAIELNVD